MSVTGRDYEPSVLAERDGHVLWVTLSNAQRRNALTVAMWRDLATVFSQANDDSSVQLVVVQGAGQTAFSAGADISEFGEKRQGGSEADYDRLTLATFGAILNCGKPTIALIRGFCFGGGVFVALSCDLRIAAEGASFAIPAAKLGLALNPRLLPLLLDAVGAATAKEIIFTGRRILHEEAREMGLVNRVHPADAFDQASRALVAEIAANAPLTLKAAKRAAMALTRRGLGDFSELDELMKACFQSSDYAEGRAAFMEKRKPRFEGR